MDVVVQADGNLGEVPEAHAEVTRAEFLKDPGAIARRAAIEGPVVVLGKTGKPSMIISFPKPFPVK